MKILVIATGGTIGSTDSGASIDVSAERSCAVVSLYQKDHPDVLFATLSPVSLLSEQISFKELNILAKTLLTMDAAPYDGLIVTCGSDNLGYLSAFIGLLTCRLKKPVAIVASDKVLTDPSANGYVNFCAAVRLIERGEAGAFVPYRNSDGVVYVHAATDLRQADESDDFFSFHGAYAIFENDDIILMKNYIQHIIPPVFDAEHLPMITDNVMLIHPYPLMDYDAIPLGGKRAVLHTLYHSGTLDSEGAVSLIKRLGDVPLYLASLRSGRQFYRTTADAVAAGAIPLYDISPECAYMKLLLACAQDRMSIRCFMEEER